MNSINRRIESNTSYIDHLFLNIKSCPKCGERFLGKSKLCKTCNRDNILNQII